MPPPSPAGTWYNPSHTYVQRSADRFDALCAGQQADSSHADGGGSGGGGGEKADAETVEKLNGSNDVMEEDGDESDDDDDDDDEDEEDDEDQDDDSHEVCACSPALIRTSRITLHHAGTWSDQCA